MKNVFVLVQVLLFPRGVCAYSTIKTAASGASSSGLTLTEHLRFPEQLIGRHLRVQGTLCPIDLRPGESFRFSFKFSWAVLHHHQFQMPGTCPYTWPGGQIPVFEVDTQVAQKATEGMFVASTPGPPAQGASEGGVSEHGFEC